MSEIEVKMATDALKIVTHDDVEQANRTLGRSGSPKPGNALDPARLIDMLGDIESLKREIQDRMRRIEAVRQAKCLLEEDALRTEALNKRLAEIGKVMSAVHSGLLVSETDFAEPVISRIPSRESAPAVEPRQTPILVVHEGVALAWPKTEEAVRTDFKEEAPAEAVEATVLEAGAAPPAGVLEAAIALSQMPEPEAEARTQHVPDAELAIEVEVAAGVPEPAFHSVEGELAGEAQGDFAGVEAPVPVATVEANEPAGRPAQSIEWADELVREARQLLEEATARLDLAVHREEQAAADFHANREAMSAAYLSATERLAEAEGFWKRADEAALEAQRLFDDAAAQLTLAASKERQSSAEFNGAQEALTAEYRSACERLEAAEKFSKDGEGFAQETRKLLGRMEAELGEARRRADLANEDLQSARQELTTAYQFASVAAQRRLDGAEFFRKTASWVVFSTAFAWMAAVWMAWAAFHKAVPFAIPVLASGAILAGAIYMKRRGARELEEA